MPQPSVNVVVPSDGTGLCLNYNLILSRILQLLNIVVEFPRVPSIPKFQFSVETFCSARIRKIVEFPGFAQNWRVLVFYRDRRLFVTFSAAAVFKSIVAFPGGPSGTLQ